MPSTSDADPRARAPLSDDPPAVPPSGSPPPGGPSDPDAPILITSGGRGVPGALVPVADESRMLPVAGSTLERMKLHVQGVVDDAKDWVEIRLKLAQREVEDRVREIVEPLILQAIGGVILALGGLFLLITLALFIGWALGHAAWGFLIVTLLLLIAGAIVFVMGRNEARENKKKHGRDPDSEAGHSAHADPRGHEGRDIRNAPGYTGDPVTDDEPRRNEPRRDQPRPDMDDYARSEAARDEPTRPTQPRSATADSRADDEPRRNEPHRDQPPPDAPPHGSPDAPPRDR